MSHTTIFVPILGRARSDLGRDRSQVLRARERQGKDGWTEGNKGRKQGRDRGCGGDENEVSSKQSLRPKMCVYDHGSV